MLLNHQENHWLLDPVFWSNCTLCFVINSCLYIILPVMLILKLFATSFQCVILCFVVIVYGIGFLWRIWTTYIWQYWELWQDQWLNCHNCSLFFVAVFMNLTISNVNGCVFLNSCFISYVDALLWGGGDCSWILLKLLTIRFKIAPVFSYILLLFKKAKLRDVILSQDYR